MSLVCDTAVDAADNRMSHKSESEMDDRRREKRSRGERKERYTDTITLMGQIEQPLDASPLSLYISPRK
jgi:hypothetical protein